MFVVVFEVSSVGVVLVVAILTPDSVPPFVLVCVTTPDGDGRDKLLSPTSLDNPASIRTSEILRLPYFGNRWW